MNFTQKLKATLAVIVLTLAFTMQANAQDRAAEGALAVTTKMKTQLSLNDIQYNKVLDINKVYLRKIETAKKSGLAANELDQKIKLYSSERETKLKSVLSSGQYKTYASERGSNLKMLEEYYKDK